ncbi:MAG: sigma-54 dependent transcriptional regulator [Candidatus Marinimicrobia bacterium]|nr:sigma-54 dependent transcriptional regulator [Candidatus Neomarinimicrobiota bacterium]
MSSILVIDDNIDVMNNVADILSFEGYQTDKASRGQEGLKKIDQNEPDCVILDLRLPDIDGWEIMDKIEDKMNSSLEVVVITAHGDVESAVKAMKKGAYDFIEKPFDRDVLIITVKRAVESIQYKTEIRKLKKSFNLSIDGKEIIAKSDSMKEVIKQVDRVANTALSILIQGETGSGKEVVANLIHQRSDRADKPFVTVDCGAIPENLIESELFGYEKGAFTGAHKKRCGKFVAANQGSLYLDEVGNLPIQHQRRLLRAVEQKTVSLLGSKETQEVDVRIISATNVDLSESVRQGEFRQDLFYRLSEFVIYIPPLRKRPEAIPYLAKKFIEEENQELNTEIKDISKDGIKKLMSYQWPGNIRELRNVIRRSMLKANEIISKQDIDLINDTSQDPLSCLGDIDRIASDYDSYKEALNQVNEKLDKKLVLKSILEANGNISKAARLYGITRKNFYKKIDKYGIRKDINL